jgi:cytochrome c-type biogenesis protein CcmH/NrfF
MHMVLKSGLLLGVVFAGLAALVAVPVAAATPGQDAAALSRELMSPFCPGLLLSDCQSSGAQELRLEIRRRFEAGESRAAIVDDLVQRFGPGVRGRPEARGFGTVAWVFPVVIAVATLLLLVSRLRRATAASGEPEARPAPAPEDPTTRARIDDELYAMD